MFGITISDFFHFTLEICLLLALGVWGFHAGGNTLVKFSLGVGVPLLSAVLWGVFRVPNDPGPAIVAVPGWLRLLLELGLMGISAWALAATGRHGMSKAFAVAILLDYVLQYKRVLWLLKG